MLNIPIDWNVFEYKFSSNPQKAFENLSYTLFCHELKQDYGVFRYFNQPYIETQPVAEDNGTVTGFQSKYYDASTRLSTKESDLKDAIKNTKTKYPTVNRIIFYINKEMSSSSKKDKVKPAYQENIEKCGTDNGITIEWRVLSHFEHILLRDEFTVVRDLYFNPNPGIQRFINNIQAHSESVLDGIKSNIEYQNKEIKIVNCANKLDDFKDSDYNAFVIHGKAGTGKSGFIKDFVSKLNENDNSSVCCVFSAPDMDLDEDILFLKQYGNYQLEDLFSSYNEEKLKICVIDAAEKYTTFKHIEVFRSIINKFITNGWKIIFTIRTTYKDGFCSFFLDNIKQDEYEINQIDEKDLIATSEQYGFVLPSDSKVRSLLCNLFYLNLYLKLGNLSDNEEMNVNSFLERVWCDVIRNETYRFDNLPARRETFLTKMVLDMLRNESYVYKLNADDDYKAVSGLCDSEIILLYDKSKDLWRIGHDVYEEIVVNHILSDRFENGTLGEGFFEDFGSSMRSRKMFRIWFETRLEHCDSSCIDFLHSMLSCDQLEQSWKDEAMIALMNSESPEAISALENLIGQNEFRLFPRVVFLLNTTCRGLNHTQILEIISEQDLNKYHFTKPVGHAWFSIFSFINKNYTLIPWTGQNIAIVLKALQTWVHTNSVGTTTRLAGLIALFLSDYIWEEKKKYYWDTKEIYEQISDIILSAAHELKIEMGTVYDEMIEDGSFRHTMKNYILLEKSVSNVVDCSQICSALPSKLIQLLNAYWISDPKEKYYYGSWEIEESFGIRNNLHHTYYPTSAYQTPVYLLLRANPKESIDFILELLNHATECYQRSELNNSDRECYNIDIIFSDTEKQRQICSDRLWKMHRGTSVAPMVLECVLMALEKWLLDNVEEFPELVNRICIYLLRHSTSAAITSVIVSIITAYPEEMFEISCILLKTKEIFHFDISRYTAEIEANFLRGNGGSARELYDNERIRSNNAEFRHTNFETVILNYQSNILKLPTDEFNHRLAKLYNSIDEATKGIDSWDPVYQFSYYRMDLRKYTKICSDIQVDTNIITLEADVPKALSRYRERINKKFEPFRRHMDFGVWAYSRYTNDKKTYKQYDKYEKNAKQAYSEAKQILIGKDGTRNADIADAIYACVVLLRDFGDDLNKKQFDFCKQVLLDVCYDIIDKGDAVNSIVNTEPLIREISKMVSSSYLDADWNNPLFLILALTMNYEKNRDYATNSVAETIWNIDNETSLKIVYTYVQMISKYNEQVNHYNGMRAVDFFDAYKNEIQTCFNNDIHSLDTIDYSPLNFNSLMIVNTMLNSKDESVFGFVLDTGKIIWPQLFDKNKRDSDSSNDYYLEYEYKSWLANFVLNSSPDQQNEFLQTLMPLVKLNNDFGKWIWDIILAEDISPRYDAFWSFWNMFKNYIFSAYDKNKDFYVNSTSEQISRYGYDITIVNYLLACNDWKKGVKSWHSLKEENAGFFLEAANRIGYNPLTLYSIARVLNTIGHDVFAEYGIDWLNTIIKNNSHFKDFSFPINTIHYIAEYIYFYIQKKHYDLRDDRNTRMKVLTVLDFLVNNGSTVGFLLREELL